VIVECGELDLPGPESALPLVGALVDRGEVEQRRAAADTPELLDVTGGIEALNVKVVPKS
jgi:hypothetical protein